MELLSSGQLRSTPCKIRCDRWKLQRKNPKTVAYPVVAYARKKNMKPLIPISILPQTHSPTLAFCLQFGPTGSYKERRAINQLINPKRRRPLRPSHSSASSFSASPTSPCRRTCLVDTSYPTWTGDGPMRRSSWPLPARGTCRWYHS